jgi:hypothetical protein
MTDIKVRIMLGDDGHEARYCEHVYDELHEGVIANLCESVPAFLRAEHASSRLDLTIDFAKLGEGVLVIVGDEMDFNAEEYIETVLTEDAYRKAFAGINDTACSDCCEEDKEAFETDEDRALASYEADLLDGVY